jgi:hypothetical protein
MSIADHLNPANWVSQDLLPLGEWIGSIFGSPTPQQISLGQMGSGKTVTPVKVPMPPSFMASLSVVGQNLLQPFVQGGAAINATLAKNIPAAP